MTEKQKAALLLAAVGAGLWLYRRGRRRHFDFAGKVVVVTGSSRGLGLVLARQLAAQQAHVVLCARDAQELDRAWEDVSQHGLPPLVLPCDLTDPDQVERLVQTVEQRLGPVDVLINKDSETALAPSWLTGLSEAAARRNNEMQESGVRGQGSAVSS
jgi:NAD(P)-dependent dehydrogenase (short-subunit alcohol dehydrogenase family)